MQTTSSLSAPTRAERVGLWVLFGIVCLFGLETLRRSAFMQTRMTDAEVFFRAGWAVRTGHDIYSVTDTNGWHYLYPSIFAALMTPLAVPPRGDEASLWWFVPYPLAVAAWYAVGVLAMALGVHWFARAIEESSEDAAARTTPALSRRWWTLRIWPVLACSVSIFSTLGRGQVAGLLLMMLGGAALAAVRARPWRAGLWLAGAISLKVFPAFLLIVPGLSRSWRWLGGAAVGLALGLFVLPALVYGPTRTLEYHREWARVMFTPAMSAASVPAATGGPSSANAGGQAADADRSRWEELHSFRRVDNQSPLSILHHAVWADTPLGERPERPARWTQLVHLGFVAVLTLTAALAAGLRLLPVPGESPIAQFLKETWPIATWHRADTVLVMGVFVAITLAATPVCQPDYFTLCVPLVMALIARGMARADGELPAWCMLLAVGFALLHVPPRIDALWPTKMYGLGMAANLGLLALGLIALRRSRAGAA